jgi:two-component system sensor histidine kinase CpxA
MKPAFPLFARLLLWSSINLVVLLAGLFLTLRLQFGPQFGGFLPDNSHHQTQAMAMVLINDLEKTPPENWGELLSHLGLAYHMDFALYNAEGECVAGPDLALPAQVRTVVMMGVHPRGLAPSQPAFGPSGGPGFPPPLEPDPADLPPGAPAPGLGHPPQLLPDFPQRVERTENPEMFWLLVHLPLDRLLTAHLTALMLVGKTPSIEGNPLLFNPNPWILLAVGMVIFSAFFWVPLTRNLTNALAQMTHITEKIAEGRFDVQVSGGRTDELGRLGLAINRMAARLKGFITGQRRFLGDVAHELCSPLARMEVALAILEERCDEKALPYVRDVREEVTRMRSLAHELLRFSKASLGENRIKLEPVRVAAVVAAAVAQEHCDASQVRIEVPEDLILESNPELLGRALANLLRNAIRYAGHAGPVTIRAWEEPAAVLIAVLDQGPGVPAGEVEKLFDPFYRIDEARASETGGVGLGLAIVKTCVEACRGTVTAFNQTGGGLGVTLRFPKATGFTEQG